MTILEAKDIFDQLVDVFADEGVADHEFSRHFNTAQMQVMSGRTFNAFIKTGPAEEPSYALEQQPFDAQQLHPLYVTALITPVSGFLDNTVIRSTFPDEVIRNREGIIETRKPLIYHMLAIETEDGLPLYEARHNDIARLRRNRLSAPRAIAPMVTVVAGGYQIEPSVTVRYKLYRQPVHVWYDEADESTWVNPELGDKIVYDIIMRAVLLAGVQIRDTALVDTIGQLSAAQ
jgi:hypothetical protein